VLLTTGCIDYISIGIQERDREEYRDLVSERIKTAIVLSDSPCVGAQKAADRMMGYRLRKSRRYTSSRGQLTYFSSKYPNSRSNPERFEDVPRDYMKDLGKVHYRNYPLYNYAGQNMIFHSLQFGNGEGDVSKFLQDENQLTKFIEFLRYDFTGGINWEMATLAHVAAYFGLSLTLREVLAQRTEAFICRVPSNWHEWHDMSQSATPLEYAAVAGRLSAVKVCLDSMADPNNSKKWIKCFAAKANAMMLAQRYGHKDIVEELTKAISPVKPY